MTTTRDSLLADLRALAADRPAHAKALELIITWHEQWTHDPNAAPTDPTDGLPKGCSARVAEALDTDVYQAFNLQLDSPTCGPVTREYAERRHVDARAAALRHRDGGIRDLQNLMNFGGTR